MKRRSSLIGGAKSTIIEVRSNVSLQRYAKKIASKIRKN
jgi:hypothetical protein